MPLVNGVLLARTATPERQLNTHNILGSKQWHTYLQRNLWVGHIEYVRSVYS